MDHTKENPRSSRGQGTVVFADSAYSTQATPLLVEPGQRKRRNAASGEVIDRLKASHPAFASQRPLAIGIRASLAAAHPEIDPRLLHIALTRWCGHPGYLGALIAGGPRYALDGSVCGEVSEEHRAAAVLRLQRPSRAPAPPLSSASAFSVGTRATLSLKSRRRS